MLVPVCLSAGGGCCNQSLSSSGDFLSILQSDAKICERIAIIILSISTNNGQHGGGWLH